MANKLAPLIKEARTNAKLTQEKLAAEVSNFSAADLSKAERGELIPTTDQLKAIARATGVTQKSLLDAAKASTPAKKTTTAKTTTAKTTTAKKTTTSKASSAKTTAKVPANANISIKVTSTEKSLIEAYRNADSNTKKTAMKVLKGEFGDKITSLLGGGTNSVTDGLSDLLGNAVSSFFNK